MKPKLKWKVSEAETGRYASFHKRAFPSAYWNDGSPAAYMSCELSYQGAYLKSPDLPNGELITIRVTIPDGDKWKWAVLKLKAKSVPEAKQIVKEFFENNPHVIIAKGE